MTCQERSGFLFAHDCDRLPSGVCALCGKSICLIHTRMGSGGMTCITCSLVTSRPGDDATTSTTSTTSTTATTTDDADDPFTYARSSSPDRPTWDERDRAAFTGTASSERDRIEDDAHAT